jgi:hypothetical protein
MRERTLQPGVVTAAATFPGVGGDSIRRQAI